MHRLTVITALLGTVLLIGCRGSISNEPPVHLNRNMDVQQRFDPQEANRFFADGRAMRKPVPGTVARGMLRADTRFYEGKDENGAYVAGLPAPLVLSRALMLRGQERYDIYCTVCHGKAGDGQGIITTGNYGYAQVPSYHTDRLRQIEDGYLYEVISNGSLSGLMPGYAQQIPVADRWAITAYIRALQRSQNATAADLPPGVLEEINR